MDKKIICENIKKINGVRSCTIIPTGLQVRVFRKIPWCCTLDNVENFLRENRIPYNLISRLLHNIFIIELDKPLEVQNEK